MPKPLEDFVKQVLAENQREIKIQEAIRFGWAALENQMDKDKWRRKSTRAAIVWENTISKAIELLADDPGVRIVGHHDTLSFIIEDSVLIRFKKADISLRTHNVQTELAELFHDHGADLFGYMGLQRVEAVYVLDRFEREIIWTGIVARENNSHLWHFPLVAEPVEVPALPMPERAKSDPALLAKLKDTAKKSKRTKGE